MIMSGHIDCRVMLCDLCLLAKGALMPLHVQRVQEREDNQIHALHVHKTHHRLSLSSNLDKAPFNHIGRPELAP